MISSLSSILDRPVNSHRLLLKLLKVILLDAEMLRCGRNSFIRPLVGNSVHPAVYNCRAIRLKRLLPDIHVESTFIAL